MMRCVLFDGGAEIRKIDVELFEKIGSGKCIVVVNKTDSISENRIPEIAKHWIEECGAKEIIFISALKDRGVRQLLDLIEEKLPESPPYYEDDIATTSSVKLISSEHVRQELFDQMRQEIPYSIAVVIEKYDESAKPIRIHAAIIVERDSQKAMVIGKRGSQIKKIGMRARKRIEKLIGEHVYLELFVKVEKGLDDQS